MHLEYDNVSFGEQKYYHFQEGAEQKKRTPGGLDWTGGCHFLVSQFKLKYFPPNVRRAGSRVWCGVFSLILLRKALQYYHSLSMIY